MKYIYYPGCSLKSTGKPYEESILSIFKALDTPLEELKDWNCCGATAYMSVDELKCFALSARNMALALNQANGTKDGTVNLVAPCSACYALHLKTQHYMEKNPEVGRVVKTALKEAGLENQNLKKRVAIRHPLDVLVNDIGLSRVKEKVKNAMKGLKVVCYYGCLLVRPYATFDSPYNPTSMDRLVEAIGAEPIDWPLKTKCCGGTLSGTILGVGVRPSYLILKEAQKRKADLVLTACPLCQFDLECFQEEMRTHQDKDIHMPVAFFTQLLGRAFNLKDKEVGIQRLFTPLPQQAAAK